MTRRPKYSFKTEYYTQRSCVPGTLIISEAIMISKAHAGRFNAPGIWSEAQISAWKEIVDAVHAKGCRIWCQLWAQGRAAVPECLEKSGGKFMSSSVVPLKGDGNPVPEEMTEEDIWSTISEYATAAKNAMEAGFDGVEVHGSVSDQYDDSIY
jgi:NADPH2 dehydrogenase